MSVLGFLGFGEAAFHFGSGLVEAGKKDVYAYDRAFSPDFDAKAHETAMDRIQSSGVRAVASVAELVKVSDFVVMAVPATAAKAAAEELLASMSSGDHLVDVCSSSPDQKLELAGQCEAKGVIYTDCPMLGPLPVYREKVPMAASGAGAKAWRDAMTPEGLVIELIEGEAGKASRIKLARSIFTKGFEALLVETFQFARKNGVEDVVMRSVEDSMDRVTFRQSATRYMAGDLVHAARRAHELEDAVEIMKSTGLKPLLAEGALQRLRASEKLGAAEKLGGKMPETLDEVYAIWEQYGAI